MKTVSEITEYYDNKLPYFKYDIEYQNPRHNRIKTSLSGIVKRDSKVLELGCGIGVISKFMAQLGAHVTAVDLSPKVIEYAQANMSHKNIEYVNQDITDMMPATAYDVIVLADVFEHIPCEKINKLMKVIKTASNEKTVIYLNIPDGRFQSYMKQNHNESLQIVDEVYHIPEILVTFGTIGYTATRIEMYGIDVVYQYNEVLFTSSKRMDIYYAALNERIRGK
jgi:SAM-dependent methyltransferase